MSFTFHTVCRVRLPRQCYLRWPKAGATGGVLRVPETTLQPSERDWRVRQVTRKERGSVPGKGRKDSTATGISVRDWVERVTLRVLGVGSPRMECGDSFFAPCLPGPSQTCVSGTIKGGNQTIVVSRVAERGQGKGVPTDSESVRVGHLRGVLRDRDPSPKNTSKVCGLGHLQGPPTTGPSVSLRYGEGNE